MVLARSTNLQMDSNLTNLRRPRQESLHDMPPARQETWLQETAEVQAAVSARATKCLEEPCLRAQAHRVELNERSNKYFYRCMRAKTLAKCVKLLAANGEPASAPEAIKERLCEFYTELFAQGKASRAVQNA
ncbi:hypothetical protein IWW39_001442 [Coemansia spiralis]|uniref:Uncharacterized protein n=1 Tax=Coemansia spiralis TaxID=417178 RepID=A0A9W8L691_9FUNG|nr:hypothetical protein IWW39_001442 [Coemansia spiralis]